MNTPPLNYVFRVSVQSCSNPDLWIERSLVRHSNTGKSSPQQLAGIFAAHHLKPDERGVRVEFLGLQAEVPSIRNSVWEIDPAAPITPLNPFTLTLQRTNQPV